MRTARRAPLGDLAETAIKEVFGDHAYELAVSSTKSMTRHCFEAAGDQAMMCVLALPWRPAADDQLRASRSDCDLDYVTNESREVDVKVALSNAMGLGGHNGCVLLGRTDREPVSSSGNVRFALGLVAAIASLTLAPLALAIDFGRPSQVLVGATPQRSPCWTRTMTRCPTS